jgi:hypothetical protein
MPHGAYLHTTSAFLFPANLGGNVLLVVGTRENFFLSGQNKDFFFFFGQNRRLWELSHLL